MTKRFRQVTIGWVALTALLGAAPHSAQSDAAALLARVAARYQAMKDYDLEVTVRNSSVPLAEFVRVYHIAASGPSKAHLTVVRGSGSLPDRIVSDGDAVWTARNADKSYTEEQLQGKPFSNTDAGRQLAAIQLRYKERFSAVAARPQRTPKFEGYRDLDVAGKKLRCAVIRTAAPKSEPAASTWTEVLWINPDSALVMRSEGAFPPGSGSPGMETLPRFDDARFAWHAVEPPLDPALFRYSPPAGFHKVDRLRND